jgi:hypothetical protein
VSADLIPLLVCVAMGVLVTTLLVCIFWDNFQTENWLGNPPTLREQARLWQGNPSVTTAARIIARELVLAFPDRDRMRLRDQRSFMVRLTQDVDTYLRTENACDARVAALWVHRHGLNSFEDHLAAGYSTSELNTYLATKRLPDAEATTFLAAMSPARRTHTAPWPVRDNANHTGDLLLRMRWQGWR